MSTRSNSLGNSLPNSLAGTGQVISAPRELASVLARELAGRCQRLWQAYWSHRARRATILMLEALDDRTLKDIGLSRSEIRPAVLGSDPGRPRPYDSHWHRPPAA